MNPKTIEDRRQKECEKRRKEIRLRAELQSEKLVHELWGYVRDNQHSLESERVCGFLKGAIEIEKESTVKQMESFSDTAIALKAKNKELVGQIKELKRALDRADKMCEHMHHDRSERHEAGEECPVEKWVLKALEE